MHPLASPAAVLLLAAAANAQLIVIPEGMALTSPASTTQTWSSAAFRCQLIYAAAHFIAQGVTGPITIHRLRFRAAQGVIDPGGQVYPGDGTAAGVNIALGTSATGHSTPSTDFASNRGTMQSVMTWGTVVVGAAGGSEPNDYIIDVPVPGGFVYDPHGDFDLLIELDGPAPTAAVPATASSFAPADGAVAIVAPTQTATSGTVLQRASVVLLDFTGPGGYPGIGPALATAYGQGCYVRHRSFYERFAPPTTFDLAGTAGAANSILLVPDHPTAPTRYTVTAGANGWFPPVNPATSQTGGPIGDDTMTGPLDFGAAFTLGFVGGSTGVVHANANGYVILGPTAQQSGDFTPTVAELLAQGPRLCPAWYDFDPSRNLPTNPAAGLYFDVDAIAGRAYVTWLDVGEFAVGSGQASHSFQVVLSADGRIECRWLAMAPFALLSRDAIVGFSPGGGSADPGNRDLSASLPFATDPVDARALTVAVDAAPILGRTIRFVTTGIPPAAIVSAGILSWIRIDPGIPLAPLAPGCFQHVDPALGTSYLILGSPTGVVPFQLPPQAMWLGVQAAWQSASLVPGVNPQGLLASNGIALTLGTVE